MVRPTEAEIVDYERRLARRRARRQRRAPLISTFLKYVLWLGALAVLGWVLDLALATFYTADGQQGGTISGVDMTSGVPLVGVASFVALVIGFWALWHNPGVQKRRAVRHAARARLAAQLGPEHPVRQFRVLHPYLSFFLRTMPIFELLQVTFGRVVPRRR